MSIDRVLSIGAIVVSVISIIVTGFLSWQSNKTSSQALAVSTQANEIAVGRLREYPRIEIHASDDEARASARTDEELKKLKIAWNVWNTGNKMISAFTLEIIAMRGLTYSLDLRPMDEPKELGDVTNYKIALAEQVTPDAIVRLDITKPILTHLRNLTAQYKEPTTAYRSALYVAVLPQESETTLPIQTPGQGNKDRQLLNVDYTPSVLKSEAGGQYIASLQPNNSIFPNNTPFSLPSRLSR
jgi:hypothetical protein